MHCLTFLAIFCIQHPILRCHVNTLYLHNILWHKIVNYYNKITKLTQKVSEKSRFIQISVLTISLRHIHSKFYRWNEFEVINSAKQWTNTAINIQNWILTFICIIFFQIQGKPIIQQRILPSPAVSIDVPFRSTIAPGDESNNIIFSPWKAFGPFVDTIQVCRM